MASKQSTIDYILEQIAPAGSVSARKMFGEYGVYCDDKMVILVCDDQCFVKPTEAGRAFIGSCTEGLPYPGAKPWFLIAADQLEDSDWLCRLVKITLPFLTVPQKKPKAKRKAATTSPSR